ncbi:MAG TPA: HAD-IIIA family hydrolase [Flavobacteriaceae bacterium]|nr:HAD-IIIA family hydrolase [Flavobacteriaceae bacterium]
MENNYKEDLKNISTFIFDVDGVLTDGSLLIDSDGNMLRKMNVKDGYALKAAIDCGYNVCVISGGTNESVRKRLEGLLIKVIHLGSDNKIEQLNSFIKKYNLDKKSILFMGDDIPDIPILKVIGLPCCPQDATPEVKDLCSYVSHKNGGMGAVRDVIKQVMKIQNNWAV